MEYLRSYARIDLDAVGKNVAGVRAVIPDGTKIMAIIKANAYGHGAVALARYLDAKVDWYGVATLHEALELRKANVEKDILVLGAMDPAEYPQAVRAGITVAISSYANAEKLSAEANRQSKPVKVHIKVDTGMSRIGFQANDENASLVKRISEMPFVEVEGMFTHFAIADSADKTSALTQRDLFDCFVDMCNRKGVRIPLLHVNNSAGTMELHKHYGMVRMGIMLYGLYPSDEMDKSYVLYPAMSLVSHISYIKTLEKGRGVSYGHTFVTEKETRVATVNIGYADGYSRALSSNAEVLVRGARCKVLGRVCMDQLMVDVTEVPDAVMGDEVVLFGRMGNEFIPVEELAEKAFSFNYEFVCGIAPRVPRVYLENGELKETVTYII